MRSWTVPVLCLVAACTSHRAWPCFQDDLTIKQGVDGFLGSCFHGGCPSQPQPIIGTEVEIYGVAPPGDPVPTGAPIATTSTNVDGFYEIAADAGSYDLCWLSHVCTAITIPPAADVRFDVLEQDLVADQWQQQTTCP